jgi:Mg-chelatase subunit ChlD
MNTEVITYKKASEISHIVFLLDKSGSMLPKWSKAMDGIKEFFEPLKNNLCTFVVFNDNMEVLCNGKNIKEINNILKDISPTGTTSLRDSVIEMVKLLENENIDYFVLVTDGADTSSTKSKDEYLKAINTLKKRKIEIILIGDNINTKHRAQKDGIPNILDIDLRNNAGNLFRQLSERISLGEPLERNYSITSDNISII